MSQLNSLFDRAANDRLHGAGEIEIRLIADLLDSSCGFTALDLVSGAQRLLMGQPAMANLRNLAHELSRGDVDSAQEWLRRRSFLLSQLDERFAAAAWPLVEGAERVLTISRSSAVASVLEGVWRRGWRGETVVFDGSAAGGGASQAAALAETMDCVFSQPDSTMVGWFAGASSRVLVGADAVSPERLVNISGTRILLELATARAVPVIVLADSGKDLPDDEIDELLAESPEMIEEGARRRWPIFEAAPLEFVTNRIRE
jgi:translation initiation factor 2B subunit (eIF-2B alpha/beta/delta family)